MAFLKLPAINNGSKLHEARNYIIMYFCFALGGVPFFYQPKAFKVIFIIFLLVIFFRKYKKPDSVYLKVILFLLIIFIAQTIKFGAGTIINFGYIFIIVSIPYLSLKIVGNNFLKYFINITYFFAVISLIFYTVSSLSPQFYAWTATLPSKYNLDPSEVLKKGFIVYSWERDKFQGLLRNPGPFWEPSVYANYLNLSIIFNIINSGKLLNRKNIVFILAMITTFSTGGYVALFIVIMAYVVYTKSISKYYRLLLVPLLGIVFYIGYNDLDFLGNKISTQYQHQTTVQAEGTGTSGRFLGARKSLISFSRHPVFGRGLTVPTMAEQTDDEGGRYGFISVLARLGVVGFVLWIIYFYKYPVRSAIFNGYTKKMGIGFFIAMLATNFGQAGYDKPMYLMVFFGGLLGLYFWKDKNYMSERTKYYSL